MDKNDGEMALELKKWEALGWLCKRAIGPKDSGWGSNKYLFYQDRSKIGQIVQIIQATR